MRLIRLYLAIALLRASRLLMLAGGRIVEAEADCWVVEKPSYEPKSNTLRPIDRMLIASIISLGICTLWIWISARAGR